MKKTIAFIMLAMVMALVMPHNVFAEEDYIAKILTDGKLVVPSVPPTNDDEFYMMVDEWIYDTYGEGYSATDDGVINCNEDYTKCKVYYKVGEFNEEKGMYELKVNQNKEVEFFYDYDPDVKKAVDEVVKKFPEEEIFHMTDVEFLNYLIYGLGQDGADPETVRMSTFSNELKKLINYKNFSIDVRMGDDAPYYTLRMGAAKITHDGITYYLGGQMGVDAKHVIYIDDDATDILKAVEERIKEIFGNVNVKVSDPEITLEEFLEGERETFIEQYNNYLEEYNQWGFNEEIINEFATADEYADSEMNKLYYSEDSDYYFLNDAEDMLVGLTINDYLITTIAVIKDSSKVDNSITYKSSDVKTDVTVSTDSAVPLDSLITAAKITSGEEFDKINKELNSDNNVIYNITIYSKSIGKNITELENGNFLVSIPVPEEMEGKELIVYYIPTDGEKEEHEVTVKDGYAEFETDHFSTYVLTELEETSGAVNEDTEDIAVAEPIPNTYDSINTYIIIGVIGVALMGAVIYLKRKEVK